MQSYISVSLNTILIYNEITLNNKKKILKNFGGLAFTTGLALVTQGSSGLVMGFINGIAGDLASSFIEKIEYEKLSKLLQETDPSELNHDLRKLIVKALEWTVANISILYKKELSDPKQKNELKQFTNSLIEDIKVLNDSLVYNEKSLYNIIETPHNTTQVLEKFDIKIEEFPTINTDNPFNTFFKNNFVSNLQLCFGELLKSDENKPAYIAYQREIYQKLNFSIDKIIEQNNEILKKLDDSESKRKYRNSNKLWSGIKKKSLKKDLRKSTLEFENSLNNQLSKLSDRVDIIYDNTEEIKEIVGEIKGISKGISRGLNDNWVSKNKVLILSLFALLIFAFISVVYTRIHTPFEMNIGIMQDTSIAVHKDYPKLSTDARIRVYLPYETKEKEVTFSNEIILNQIPYKFEGSKSYIELIDRYWALSMDSIIITKGYMNLFVRPNERLAKVYGRVLNQDGSTLIENAKIMVEDQLGLTNKRGEFEIDIPIEKRKPRYTIRVISENYKPIEVEYMAGSEKEIRLIN